MVSQARRHYNDLKLAVPLLDSEENVEGWYCFEDDYLSPEVKYTAFPPTTTVKLGGRIIEIDRATPLKIRLLEQDEDYHFWCRKKQHSKRINCGEYHKDFGDVEVGYSFSSPQTHIWFAGYAIHADCFENLFFSSAQATVRVTPEHVLPPPTMIESKRSGYEVGYVSDASRRKMLAPANAPLPTRSLFEMVVDEGADFPVYNAAVPKQIETYKGYRTVLVPTPEFVNDCERDIIQRDVWDAGVAVSQISQPVSYPPTYPPVQPFEHAGLFWSYIYNELMRKRCAKDEMENAVRDMGVLRRFQQYDHDAKKKDKEYYKSLDRLSQLLTNKKIFHDIVWPIIDKKCEGCKCLMCKNHKGSTHHRSARHHMHGGGHSVERSKRRSSHRHHRYSFEEDRIGESGYNSPESNSDWRTPTTRYVATEYSSPNRVRQSNRQKVNPHQINQAWDTLSQLGNDKKPLNGRSGRTSTAVREYWPQSYFSPVT